MPPKVTDLATSSAHTDLLAALPVTAEATTSRVVVNNPLIRLVVFAFDSGEVLTDHASPRAVVVHLLTGAVRLTMAGAEHAMVPGDVLYLAPNEVHSLIADAPSHLSLVMVEA